MYAFVTTENLQLYLSSALLDLSSGALHYNNSTRLSWISILFSAIHRQRVQMLPVTKSVSQPVVLSLSKTNTDFIKAIEKNTTKLLRHTFFTTCPLTYC